jgi:hypothetical protein
MPGGEHFLGNRSGSGRAHPKTVFRWFEPRLRLQTSSKRMIVICLIGTPPSTRPQLNADGRQGSGSGPTSWSGFPPDINRERPPPCAAPYPLLRSTSRAGRVSREEAAHGSDAEPPTRSSVTTCRPRSRAPDDPVEPTVTGTTIKLAPCLQDAAPPAGCSVLSAAPARRCDLTKGTVEERLPLVARGRATPLAVFRFGRYRPMPSSA